MNVQSLTLDLSKKSEKTPIVRIGQGDKNGTTLRATIKDNGETPDLSGATVKLRIKLPKKAGYYEKTGTLSGNVASFAVNEAVLAVEPGITDVCYIEVTIDGATTSTERFRTIIERTAAQASEWSKLLLIGMWRRDAGTASPSTPRTIRVVQRPSGSSFYLWVNGERVTISISASYTVGGNGNEAVSDYIEIANNGKVTLHRQGMTLFNPTVSSVSIQGSLARIIVASDADTVNRFTPQSSVASAATSGQRITQENASIVMYLNTSEVGTTSAEVGTWWQNNKPQVLYKRDASSTVNLGTVTMPTMPVNTPTFRTNTEIAPRFRLVR